MQKDHFVSIFLVDDHAIFRAGIVSQLSQAGHFTPKIIGEAASGAEFFAAMSAGLIPDLVILDIVLPDITGVEIARHLKKEHPDVKILMLSSEVSPELIDELLNIGVEGYLGKSALINDIESAVCSIMGGVQYYGRSVMKVMYDVCVTRQFEATQRTNKIKFFNKPKSPAVNFTERENEIIELLCDGLLLKEIAEKLGISPRTVETHKNNILNKLGFSRITDLIKYALREGLIS